MSAAHRHMCSAGHSLAAHAAEEMLSAGGNAADAGVAGGLALGVVQSDYVNIAGVAPIMFRDPAGHVTVIDGVGVWPRRLDPSVFARAHGGVIPRGILRTVVPAAPAAWIEALSRFGTMRFADVAAPAIRLAREGFPMHWLMADRIAANAAGYAEWPANAAIYLPDGRAPRPGETFVQSDLAATLQYMADEAAACGERKAGLAAARRAFYEGDIAAAIVAFHEAEGGLLRRDDLAEYAVELSDPLAARFRGGTTLCSGPFCQGPALGQVLQLLDRLDWAGVAHNGAAHLHRLVECIKLAFADREACLGDPRFIDVPVGRLLDPDYAVERLTAFDPARATPGRPAPGSGIDRRNAPEGTGEPAPGDTSYLAVIDAEGAAFSATPSDVSYNSPLVPGTGLVPSSRGSASWADPGHPSAAAPGRRPRLTPNPAIHVDGAGEVMPFGTPGGDVQVQAMAQFLINRHVFGMGLQEAVEAPRVASYSYPSSFSPHTEYPGLVKAEARIDPAARDELSALGHRVEAWPDHSPLAGAICAVVQAGNGELEAACDPRRPTGVAGGE